MPHIPCGHNVLIIQNLNVKWSPLMFPLALNGKLQRWCRSKDNAIPMRLVEQMFKYLFTFPRIDTENWSSPVCLVGHKLDFYWYERQKHIRRLNKNEENENRLKNEEKIWIQTRVCNELEVFYTNNICKNTFYSVKFVGGKRSLISPLAYHSLEV